MPKKEYKRLKKELVKVRCDFCRGDNCYKLFGNLVGCRSCGLVYANPRPSKEKLEILYKNYYDASKSGIKGPNDTSVSFENIQEDINTDRIKLIEKKLGKKGKILDIGCGVGYFLQSAKERGWSVYGVEPSKEAKKLCSKKGIKVIEPTNFKKYSGLFDAVTLFHVLEHIESPKEYLPKISKLVKKKGIVMIEVPNINSFNAKRQKKKWWYVQDMHLFYFSPATIKRYLVKAGFKDIRIRPKGGFLINQMSGLEGGINKSYNYLKLLKKIYYFISETFNLSDCIQIIAVKK